MTITDKQALIALGVLSQLYLLRKIKKQKKRLDRITVILSTYIENDYQKSVDELFVGIVNNIDD